MKRSVWTCWLVVFTMAVAACGSGSPRAAEDQGAGTNELEQELKAAEPAGSADEQVAKEPDLAPAPFDSTWSLEVSGIGPVRMGMSVQEVVKALDGAVNVPEELGGCDYVFPRGWPEGLSVMVVDGRVARIEVWGGEIATAEGARIGMSEQEIHALYPGQVEVRPHKYTDGNYLIITPAGPLGAEHRIVFETDGSVVERYRAGVLPAVEWVEGCA